MENKNKFSSMWKGKGFYIALGVCVFAAVISSALAINRMIGGLGTQNPASSGSMAIESGVEDPWDQGEQVGKAESGVKVEQPSSSSQSGSSSSSASGAAQETQPESGAGQTVQEPSFSLPVEGRVVVPYSGDELVYNETLEDWRTHNGIDISASSGAPVSAAMAGEVTAVGENGIWGYQVEIASGDLTLRYCGLNEDVQVKVGDTVTQGQQIATLGEVPAELAQEPHLHFEVLRGESLIDPGEIMN